MEGLNLWKLFSTNILDFQELDWWKLFANILDFRVDVKVFRFEADAGGKIRKNVILFSEREIFFLKQKTKNTNSQRNLLRMDSCKETIG